MGQYNQIAEALREFCIAPWMNKGRKAKRCIANSK